MRGLDDAAFDRAFAALVTEQRWQEEPEYYRRYRTRYEAVLTRFGEKAPERTLDVLDVGGGQLAFLAAAVWGDHGCVADIEESCFPDLRARGIETFRWNIAAEDAPTERTFDAIFLCEVIAHLPVPGHVALRRLGALLRPGGLLLCSTPNLYRLRNVVYLVTGRRLFGHFDMPEERSYLPVLDYSAEHLTWQFGKAGLVDCEVELRDFGHAPYERLNRALYALGAPLRRIPRYRDHLLAVATAPR